MANQWQSGDLNQEGYNLISLKIKIDNVVELLF